MRTKSSKSKCCDVLILDKITFATDFGLLDKENIIDIVKQKLDSMIIVPTDRISDDAFIDLSDFVTEMKEIKHQFRQDVSPQIGIDY